MAKLPGGEMTGNRASSSNRRPTRSPAFRFKSLNRQNGFRTTLERLSCHKDFKITQKQTKVSFFHLNPLLQVEFRAIFVPFHTFS